ncbi:MAG: hypothetical protein IPK19_31385 [Chloroflexi bacterium]|nr:hypothetical protein [Chloroflexota bacterium]
MNKRIRADRLLAMAHIACSIWNYHVYNFKLIRSDAWWELTQEELGETMHLGRATVQRATALLERLGCLTIERNPPSEPLVTYSGSEREEKRGVAAYRYRVEKEQIYRVAVILHHHQSSLIMIQDPTGWIHLGPRQAALGWIDLKVVRPHQKLPTFANTDLTFYFSHEVQNYEHVSRVFIPTPEDIDRIFKSSASDAEITRSGVLCCLVEALSETIVSALPEVAAPGERVTG